jgi:hypothetical protein
MVHAVLWVFQWALARHSADYNNELPCIISSTTSAADFIGQPRMYGNDSRMMLSWSVFGMKNLACPGSLDASLYIQPMARLASNLHLSASQSLGSTSSVGPYRLPCPWHAWGLVSKWRGILFERQFPWLGTDLIGSETSKVTHQDSLVNRLVIDPARSWLLLMIGEMTGTQEEFELRVLRCDRQKRPLHHCKQESKHIHSSI